MSKYMQDERPVDTTPEGDLIDMFHTQDNETLESIADKQYTQREKEKIMEEQPEGNIFTRIFDIISAGGQKVTDVLMSLTSEEWLKNRKFSYDKYINEGLSEGEAQSRSEKENPWPFLKDGYMEPSLHPDDQPFNPFPGAPSEQVPAIEESIEDENYVG